MIRPDSMKRSVRGKGANTRYVCDILPDSEPAHSLLVVEVRTPSGHSSSYPPHKHDTDDLPHQSFLEETYYHQVNPSQGFVFQRVYTDDRSIDQAMASGEQRPGGGAQGLPPGQRALRVRVVLPERHGRPEAGLAVP